MRLNIIFVFLILISCKNDNNIIEGNTDIKSDEIIFVFPDTVLVNNSYSGEIRYINAFDTITTVLYQKLGTYRYINYAFTGTKTIGYDSEHLKTKFKDTVWATNNRSIPIKDIWFENVGSYYFDGIIFDEVFIENGFKNDKGESTARRLTNEIRLVKKVVVVDNK